MRPAYSFWQSMGWATFALGQFFHKPIGSPWPPYWRYKIQSWRNLKDNTKDLKDPYPLEWHQSRTRSIKNLQVGLPFARLAARGSVMFFFLFFCNMSPSCCLKIHHGGDMRQPDMAFILCQESTTCHWQVAVALAPHIDIYQILYSMHCRTFAGFTSYNSYSFAIKCFKDLMVVCCSFAEIKFSDI
jgi:hypothetical protein